jgi:hypothetical protein
MTAVKRRSLSGFEAFVLGAVAKAVATVTGALKGRCNTDICDRCKASAPLQVPTYPLQVVRTREYPLTLLAE